MNRKLRHIALLHLCLAILLASGVNAQANKPKPKKPQVRVDQDVVKAWDMNTEQAAAAVKAPNTKIAVRYIALKKLCEGKYDEKKLIPLLMAALGTQMARHLPIQRLAIEELAKRKHQPAANTLYMIVINNAAEWEIRKAAEAALEQVLPNFPETLKGALMKAQERLKDPPDPKKIAEAVKLYKAQVGPLLGQAAPKKPKGP